ncbi:MAG: threonine--tRNA ligase [Thermoprotei archaeon]
MSLKPEVLARAGLLLQYVISRDVSWLRPAGCSVGEDGFKCDFMSVSGEWPDEATVKKAESAIVELESSGSVFIAYVGEVDDEFIKLLGRSATYDVNGVKVFLESEVRPAENPVKAVLIRNVSAHNPTKDVSLVRLTGVAFSDLSEYREWLEYYEEAIKRDHRVIGQKLDLLGFYEEAGPGLVIYHPKGQIIREELIKLVREVNSRLGYSEVYTPHVYRSVLWKISGHYELYRDKMVLAEVDGEEYGVKPMNCPGHILIYKSKTRSYRDLPVRLAEFGTVYRWEKRGELFGLLRVRGFTQDDGHAFVREDQVESEVGNILKEVFNLLSLFGIARENTKIYLSTKPEKYIGSDEAWDKATESLKRALEKLGIKYEVKEGEGAFYGPKIDVHFRDSLGRWWQCSTIQVDFALPERFNLEYVDSDGSKKRPVMIHRAILGSIERFMAIIIEEFEGRLPTWLSPVQVVVVPVSKDVAGYAAEVAEKLRRAGIRAEEDLSDETMQKKIKTAYERAVPYVLVVGRREASQKTVTVRGRGNLQASNIPLDEFIEELVNEIRERALDQKALSNILRKSRN